MPEELLRATSVILLLDPEHMTAVNARKRYIRHVKEQNPQELGDALDAELYIIDSLLTSRLHRHTKSPTLWGHRQWILELCIDRQRPVDSLLTALEKLIFVSAERHPRNYYAWCHARYLLGLASRRSQGQSTADGDAQGQQQQPASANPEKIPQTVKNWCFSHPDDISGWSFLTVLVEQQQQHPQATTTTAPALFSETLHLAEAFSWRGESVWYFLRNMLRGSWVGEGDGEEFERVLRAVHGRVNEPGELDRQIMGRMLEWTKLYAEPGALISENVGR
ncbi:Protein prenyltransferase [Akanthomyces lecanii RCEF 1005]|uniref:Protein prenyltransferase n=1 Tax=Akanthomyces lecanii RCEF 1005 TaxID=1081108 RepID=A0A162IUK7_CORDF|nr:Protein prenyltransferase [Akanthomyces lecanii RCEF 1005]